MTIEKEQNGAAVCLKLAGRIDTVTSPELEKEIQAVGTDIDTLTLDFQQVEYISSAGLRVLLSTEKNLAPHGRLILTNVNTTVMEIFDVTGFSSILTIE